MDHPRKRSLQTRSSLEAQCLSDLYSSSRPLQLMKILLPTSSPLQPVRLLHHASLARPQTRCNCVMRLEADYWDLRFKGVERLYGGSGSLERLRASHVCVVGLGGVGSWTVEALVRSGVGSLTLMDLDEVCISNTNRQLHALEHTVGRTKASVLAERAALINPECRVNVREEWLTVPGALSTIRGELAERSDAQGGFAVVDAIDGVNEKAALIDACCALKAGSREPARQRCREGHQVKAAWMPAWVLAGTNCTRAKTRSKSLCNRRKRPTSAQR